MGSTRLKKIDLNRWQKVYPTYRSLPKYSYKADKDVIIETQEISFVAQDSLEFALTQKYDSMPVITATPMADIGDVNLFISSITITARIATVKIEASSAFSGKVHVQAIMIGG